MQATNGCLSELHSSHMKNYFKTHDQNNHFAWQDIQFFLSGYATLKIYLIHRSKGVISRKESTKDAFPLSPDVVKTLLLWQSILDLHYFEEATGGSINLIFSSISPDSTAQSLNQTLCTTSPFMQLIELSRARQLSVSGTTFLKIVSPEETFANCFNLAADAIGCRLRWACPILSSALKRSLSNTSCNELK